MVRHETRVDERRVARQSTDYERVAALRYRAQLVQCPDVEKLSRDERPEIECHVHVGRTGDRRPLLIAKNSQRFIDRRRSPEIDLRYGRLHSIAIVPALSGSGIPF